MTTDTACPSKDDLLRAHRFLASLRVGDDVMIVKDGRDLLMKVSAPLHLDDFGYVGGELVRMGSWESAGVTVTFGPGRYSTRISVARQAARGSEYVAEPVN